MDCKPLRDCDGLKYPPSFKRSGRPSHGCSKSRIKELNLLLDSRVVYGVRPVMQWEDKSSGCHRSLSSRCGRKRDEIAVGICIPSRLASKREKAVVRPQSIE